MDVWISAVCDNFAENGEIDKEAGHRLIVQGIMNGHETLPLGEFAIGTNTTAYAMAEKFGDPGPAADPDRGEDGTAFCGR